MKTADVIHNTTKVHFGYADRLKIMIGGVAVVSIDIETTDEVVHVKKTTSGVNVTYPEWIERIRAKFRKERGAEVLQAPSGVPSPPSNPSGDPDIAPTMPRPFPPETPTHIQESPQVMSQRDWDNINPQPDEPPRFHRSDSGELIREERPRWTSENQQDTIKEIVDSWTKYLDSFTESKKQFTRDDVKRLMGIVHDSAQKEIESLKSESDRLAIKKADHEQLLTDNEKLKTDLENDIRARDLLSFGYGICQERLAEALQKLADINTMLKWPDIDEMLARHGFKPEKKGEVPSPPPIQNPQPTHTNQHYW